MDDKEWIGLIWLRIETGVGISEHGNEPSGFLKMLRISWVAEQQSASEEESASRSYVMLSQVSEHASVFMRLICYISSNPILNTP
jgi:hypothetical protein